MQNLSAFVGFHARRTPDRTAILYRGQRITYAALDERTARFAALLAGRGIGAGDVVAAFMKNSTATVELAIAVSRLGAVFLPVNFRLAADEVAYIAGNAGVRLLVADEEFAAVVQGLPEVLLLDEAAQSDPARLAPPGARAPMARRTEEDLFRLMYTSGTTDRPKGVMHSYGNFYWKCMEHVIALGLTAQDRLLVTGPLYHVGAFDLPGLAVLWVGGSLCILREFEPAAVIRAIAGEQLTGAWLAPVMLLRVLEHGNPEGLDLSSLRWVVGGGERTPEGRIRAFRDLFPAGRYVDAYGLTETGSGDTMMEAGYEITKIGSTGRATPHVEITIRDDAGQVLPAGREGEVCLRGPKVFKGYWRDPAKTAASFHPDGWFRSGDVGYLDADGFLFLTDRRKDLIISGGENIASSEIERVVYALPQVNEVAVVGVPDPRWGEKPVAVVVLREDAALDLPTLQQHCRGHLAGFKVPKDLVLMEALPRNPSGKVLKRVLRETLSGREPAPG
ncbi:AMP-binding protein [Pseudoroseomonas ludipueritiae]|uniref:AMP-binding protein n=1 Tax=Pseudoroseomonas ludipueritiae TaxID=198093 RepID=A0ABR7R6C7_9PROT|nr:AMP-binding protein [Pseudoroseomonas ludipueritiae]MBC9177288.1 AMP-binding protein [Pseudoroseomonas ludipueritiae]